MLNRFPMRSRVGSRRRRQSPRAAWRIAWLLIFAGAGLKAGPASAQDMLVSADMQLSLFVRLLPFDRNFQERVGEEAVIGILYQRTVRASVNAKNSLLAALDEQPIPSIGATPLRVKVIEYVGVQQLPLQLLTEGVDILYVTPLRSVSLDELETLCEELQIGTLTGVPQYVDDGVAVGIGTRGGRPEIVVNLRAARAQGFDFSSQLLRLARVLQ